MAKKDTDDTLIVVASQEGVYGTYRKVGEKFALNEPAHFSKRWMVNVKDDPNRAANYAEQFTASGGAARTDEEIEAEMAVATGRSNAADAKKIARLEKENAELKARVDELEVELTNAIGLGESEVGPEEQGDPDDQDGEPEKAKSDSAPRARRTRRTAQ